MGVRIVTHRVQQWARPYLVPVLLPLMEESSRGQL